MSEPPAIPHLTLMTSSFGRSLAHIDELLVMILTYLDERTLARAACVCKHWSEIALDRLWFEVKDLKKVLSVLAPLTLKPERVSMTTGRIPSAYVGIPLLSPLALLTEAHTDSSAQAFKRALVSSDWKRFERYSRRVRRLYHDHRDLRSAMTSKSRPALIHSKVFEDLVETCPYSEIFPNLYSITWYTCSPERQPLCLAFMHRHVKHLALHLYRSEAPSLPDFLRMVRSKCSNVTSLELCLEEPIRNTENEVLVLIQGLPQLQKISLPIYGLTSRLLTELSRLRHVVAVNLIHPAHADPGNRADVAEFLPVITHDAFPALRSLSFSSQVASAAHFLRSSHFIQHLVVLHFKSVVTATSHALHEFFSIVRDSCPSLVELSVDYIIAPDSPLASPQPVEMRPSLATFQPLFSMHFLRVFELRWDYALNIRDDDLEDFARQWPLLESLQFNAEPVPDLYGPRLTLRSLIPFARYCPNIRHLGLHIDARHVPFLPQDVPRFTRLHTLAVGLSALSSPEHVTLFLSRLLPLGCYIKSGLRWPDAFGVAMELAFIPVCLRTEMSSYYKQWNEVETLLPVATKARLEEKAKFEVLAQKMLAMEVSRKEEKQKLTWLERQVHDLRTKSGGTP